MARMCAETKRLIAEGKCRRDDYRQIVLPNGLYVPGNIIGQNLKEQIKEWYMRNPGQTKAQMMVTIEEVEDNLMMDSFILSKLERIERLKKELQQLRDPALFAYT